MNFTLSFTLTGKRTSYLIRFKSQFKRQHFKIKHLGIRVRIYDHLLSRFCYLEIHTSCNKSGQYIMTGLVEFPFTQPIRKTHMSLVNPIILPGNINLIHFIISENESKIQKKRVTEDDTYTADFFLLFIVGPKYRIFTITKSLIYF